jgi:hypothetical protein
VTGGKPIVVLLQSISGVSAINSLGTFYDIHGGQREALFFYFVPDTTRDETISDNIIIIKKWYIQKHKILVYTNGLSLRYNEGYFFDCSGLLFASVL